MWRPGAAAAACGGRRSRWGRRVAGDGGGGALAAARHSRYPARMDPRRRNEGGASRSHGSNKPTWLLLTLMLAGAAGCVQLQDSAPLGQGRAAIVGGEPSPLAAVVAVGFRRASCSARFRPVCSGAVVAGAVVLTAAHCVDRLGADYEVFVGPDTAGAGAIYDVVEVTLHPDFDDVDNRHDLALLRLARNTDIPPFSLPHVSLGGDTVGQQLLLAGYGMTSPGAGDEGVRLQGRSQITSLAPGVFDTAPAPSMSCLVDSGGPSWRLQADDRQLVGVTSEGDAACAQWARNVDVGAYVDSFIAPRLQLPTPPETQRCAGPGGGEDAAAVAAGCAVADVMLAEGSNGWQWLWVLAWALWTRRQWRVREPQ